MIKFDNCVVIEDEDTKVVETTIDSETYGEVKYTSYLSKNSDHLPFVHYMTFTDDDVKVEALVNPIFAIKYDMLMDYIGEDSFTATELGRINAQVYLLNEFNKEGEVTIEPYLDVMTIHTYIIPVASNRGKAKRVRSWVNFIQTCFTSAVLDAWERGGTKIIQDSKVANHGL